MTTPGFRYATARFVVVSPCCEWQSKDKSEPLEWVSEFVRTLSCAKWIDHRRIYLTGDAMGGMGTLLLAAKRQDMFAAIALVMGCDDENEIENERIFRQLDMWYLSRQLMCLPVLLVVFGEEGTRGARSLLPLIEGLMENGADELQVEVCQHESREDSFRKAFCDSAFLFMWLERWRKRDEEDDFVADDERVRCV